MTYWYKSSYSGWYLLCVYVWYLLCIYEIVNWIEMKMCLLLSLCLQRDICSYVSIIHPHSRQSSIYSDVLVMCSHKILLRWRIRKRVDGMNSMEIVLVKDNIGIVVVLFLPVLEVAHNIRTFPIELLLLAIACYCLLLYCMSTVCRIYYGTH